MNDIDRRLDICEELLNLHIALKNALEGCDLTTALGLLGRALAVNRELDTFGVPGREVPRAMADDFLARLPAAGNG